MSNSSRCSFLPFKDKGFSWRSFLDGPLLMLVGQTTAFTACDLAFIAYRMAQRGIISRGSPSAGTTCKRYWLPLVIAAFSGEPMKQDQISGPAFSSFFNGVAVSFQPLKSPTKETYVAFGIQSLNSHPPLQWCKPKSLKIFDRSSKLPGQFEIVSSIGKSEIT